MELPYIFEAASFGAIFRRKFLENAPEVKASDYVDQVNKAKEYPLTLRFWSDMVTWSSRLHLQKNTKMRRSYNTEKLRHNC